MKVRTVGIAGGSGSGKTTLARALLDHFGPDDAVLLSHDSYYRERTPEELSDPDRLDFDTPDALDTELLAAQVAALHADRSVEVPIYDFGTHRRVGALSVSPRPVVLVEGILLFTSPALRAALDLAVFVEVPAELRLARRMARDMAERGRSRDEVLQRFERFVEPAYQRWVAPSSVYAQLVVSGTEPIADLVARVLRRLDAA